MRVVVTGAAGFIGTHASLVLAQSGHEVVGIDALDAPRHPGNLGALARTARVSLHVGDVRDREVWRAAARSDAVLHLAGRGGARLTDERALHAANVGGTLAAVRGALRGGIPRFVLVSSSSVYRPSERPLREDDPLEPVSPYGRSKLAAERTVRERAETRDFELVVVRPFSAYGPGQREDMAFARFLSAARSGGTMPRFGTGEQRRDFTYVGDIAAGLRAAVERGHPGATYNLATGRSVALGDALALLAEVAGCAPPIVESAEAAVAEPLSTCADLSRSARDLGYRPATTLREGLARQAAEDELSGETSAGLSRFG